MEEYLKVAKDIALEAGTIMHEAFGVGVMHTIKEDRSPLTDADERINRMVIDRLERAFPEHSLIGEEGRKLTDSSHVWVFDPIDGTVPFLRGVPTNVFSIALVQNGEPVLGVVYDPYMKRLYHAVAGEGAFMNGEPIRTSEQTALAHSHIEIDGHRGFRDLSLFQRALDADVRFLAYSSTVYADMLVATGQLEGVVFPLVKPWDCAAAKVIIEEAGGVTSDLHGNAQRYDRDTKGFVSAGNADYHSKLLTLIRDSV